MGVEGAVLCESSDDQLKIYLKNYSTEDLKIHFVHQIIQIFHICEKLKQNSFKNSIPM